MGLFDKFPYTNFHELNLDWIISKLAELKDSVESAKDSATTATNKASESAKSAGIAKESETNAKVSETNAKASETNAKASETNAKASETNAKTSETNAESSAKSASTSAKSANYDATQTGKDLTEVNRALNACNLAVEDAESARDAAKTSETNAKASETNAKASADTASGIKGSVASAVYYYESNDIVLSDAEANKATAKCVIRNGVLFVTINHELNATYTVTNGHVTAGGAIPLLPIVTWVESKTGTVKWTELANVNSYVGISPRGTQITTTASVKPTIGGVEYTGRPLSNSYFITATANIMGTDGDVYTKIASVVTMAIPLKFASD